MGRERTPPPAKRARRSPPQAGAEDRLGALDDTFLHAILLRMPLRDAAATVVLSRRWPRVFATLPRLVLGPATFNRRGFPDGGDEHCCEDQPRWMRALHCVLDSRTAPVTAFEIDCRFMGLHGEWFSRVFAKLCGSGGLLELRIDNTDYKECYYALPDAVYNCTTLTSLDLYNCRLRGPGRAIKLPALKSLRLREVVAGNTDIRDFISKCKAIERLEIQNIYRARKIDIRAPLLKELEICSYRPLCISVKKTPPLDMVKLSLLYAYLEDFWSPHDNMDTNSEMAEREHKQMDEIQNMKTFLFGLSHAKRLKLHLSTEYSKVLNIAKASTLMDLPKNKYLPTLQSLSLTLDHNHEVLTTLVSFLLTNSPNLKDLRIIELRHPGSPVPLDAEFWKKLIIADGSLYHLSSCTFYTDSPLEGHTCWGICKFLVMNARVLKRMSIKYHHLQVKPEHAAKLEAARRELHLWPRASADVLLELTPVDCIPWF